MRAAARAQAASSSAWVKLVLQIKELVKSPNRKAAAASPAALALWLKSQTALMVAESSGAWTVPALAWIAWPEHAASGLMPAPQPTKFNATQLAAASKTPARLARPWTARPPPALAASMVPVRSLRKLFVWRSLVRLAAQGSIVAASRANNPARKIWTTTVPLTSTTSCHCLQRGAHVVPAMKISIATERWTLPICSSFLPPTVIAKNPNGKFHEIPTFICRAHFLEHESHSWPGPPV